jgi:DNA polymerase III epsilon subunit-like protein
MQKMNNRILFIDTETGGINPDQNSLLSIGLVIWEDKKIVDQKEFFIRHETFHITPGAMEINKINLQEFLKFAKEPDLVLVELMEFLKKYFHNDFPITLGGHNTNFDIGFLKSFLTKYEIDFNKYFSYRFIDTASILKYLYYAGILNDDVSSADKAFNYFKIQVNERHSAIGDAVATAKLFTCLIETIK